MGSQVFLDKRVALAVLPHLHLLLLLLLLLLLFFFIVEVVCYHSVWLQVARMSYSSSSSSSSSSGMSADLICLNQLHGMDTTEILPSLQIDSLDVIKTELRY